ncbi:PTS system mannose/fructose/sorbose family transporter subunit IID [Erysipelotrichaceae bacterium HCN-30851]
MAVLSKKDLIKLHFRMHAIAASWNYYNQSGTGFCWAMLPLLKKLYSEGSPEMAAALKREMLLYNTTPQCHPLIMGISMSMEEQVANDPNFDPASIPNLKSSLMGPLAGVGDSFFWGTFKVLASTIGVSFATQGFVFAPLVALIIYLIPSQLVRWFGLKWGYKAGEQALTSLAASGGIQKVITASSIVGLMVIGSMVPSMVNIAFGWEYTSDAGTISLQSMFDAFVPGLLPLLITLAMYYFVRKKVKPMYMILILFVIGILLAPTKLIAL